MWSSWDVNELWFSMWYDDKLLLIYQWWSRLWELVRFDLYSSTFYRMDDVVYIVWYGTLIMVVFIFLSISICFYHGLKASYVFWSVVIMTKQCEVYT